MLTYPARQVSRTFFKGLIAIIPLALTLSLLFWLAGTAETALGRIFKFFFPDSWYVRGLGFVMGVAVVFSMGVFLESKTFRRLFQRLETVVLQVPLVRTVYTATSDFLALFSNNRSSQFKQVVMVKAHSGTGGWQIGFVTVPDASGIGSLESDRVAVFLPFSYQMGGTTVFVNSKDLIKLDMTVEDALRFVATAGVVRAADDGTSTPRKGS